MLIHARVGWLKAGSYRAGWLLAALLTVPLASWAQAPAAVRGTVATGAGAAVEFATVTLHRAADSVVVKTEFSDEHGVFRLEALAGRRYRVSVAQVGYRRYWSAPFELTGAGHSLARIVLAASQATALQDVVVTGRKPLFEHLADRTVVHVADSPLAAGATTLEVLGRAPGITLDGSDNLALRGRQGLLVYIDGKRSPLTGSDLADYLRALPAGQLESIELITNPPASYDAQGGAGVIDIKLKKDQRLGTNGSVNASYGRSEYGKFTAGLSLNHRRKNLNAYGSYTFSDRRYFTRTDFERQFLATTQPAQAAGSSMQADDQISQLYSHAGKVGLDLTPTKRTLLGMSLTGLASQITNSSANQTQFYDQLGRATDHYRALTDQDIRRPSGSANLNLRHTFADSATASSLAADLDYARYHVTRLLALNTYASLPGQFDDLLSGDQRSNLNIGAAKVDYSKPLPHRARLEAGAKVTQVTSDNDVNFYDTTNGTTTFRSDISSQFTYRENVNAAYAALRGQLLGTTLRAGLRAEQTNTLAEQAGSTLRERHYLQLFPSALLEHALNDRHALALALGRRVDRPIYGQVNPLRAYLDATTYRAGNPYLTASTTYNTELTYTYRQKFSAALAYARTDQPIVGAVQPSADKNGQYLVMLQDVNLSTQHFYTLTLTAPFAPTPWWTLYANAIGYYNRYVGFLNGTDLDRGRLACNLTLNSSFTLPRGWSAELNALYESKEVAGFQLTQDRGQVAIGLQKSLWNKQGTFRLGATDIFYTTPIRATATYNNFTESYYQRLDLRVVTASLSYRFGNSKVAAARRRAAGADEELRRAGGQ